ncbi:hypothetical protein VPH35_031710 [Triticum aestivum]
MAVRGGHPPPAPVYKSSSDAPRTLAPFPSLPRAAIDLPAPARPNQHRHGLRRSRAHLAPGHKRICPRDSSSSTTSTTSKDRAGTRQVKRIEAFFHLRPPQRHRRFRHPLLLPSLAEPFLCSPTPRLSATPSLTTMLTTRPSCPSNQMSEPRSQTPPSTTAPTTLEVPTTTCNPLTTTRSS